jgi:hypothetical protein
MARGRKPQGDQPLSGAERQARYRTRHARAPVVHYRRPIDRRSRHQRWREAVAELVTLQSEYAQWFEALPDPLRDSATAGALQGHHRSRSRRPHRGRAAAQLWARLRRRCEPRPRLAHWGPQAPPAHCSARLATVAAQCAGPSCGLSGRPAPPCHTHHPGGVNSSCRQGSIPDIV